MGAMASGMAHGVGFSAASRVVDGVMGPRQMEMVHRNEDGSVQQRPENHAAAATQGHDQARLLDQQNAARRSCVRQQEELTSCMQENADLGQCQFYFDQLKACQRDSTADVA